MNTTFVKKKNKNYLILGFLGALFDIIGGGGYGPIVTGSLIIENHDLKNVIGTVNSSEFFIALTSSIGFSVLINDINSYFKIILGLIIGGVVASPIAARFCIKNIDKQMYFIIGIVLILLNTYNIFSFFIER